MFLSTGKLTAVKHIVLDNVKLEIDIVKQFGDRRTPVCLVHHRTLDEPSERDTENAIKVKMIESNDDMIIIFISTVIDLIGIKSTQYKTMVAYR